MLHILRSRNIHTLAEFAASNVMLAFDYDGTLAPIAARPELARMRRPTRRLLSAVSRRYPAVVISGRSREDLMRRVGSVPVWHISGNHGLEPWGEQPKYHAQVRSWVDELQARLGHLRGVEIEDKAYSITVHFRHAPDDRRALGLSGGW